jgi:hypothetical protein
MNQTGHNTPGTLPAGPAGKTPGTSGPEQGTTARRPHPHRTARLLAVTAAVAAAAVTAALLARPAGRPPSPLAALTSALARTPQESYSFRLDFTVTHAGRDIRSVTVSGTLDPAHQHGTELLNAPSARSPRPSWRARISFTGKYVYTRVSPSPGSTMRKPWDKTPALATAALPASDPDGFVSDQPVSPGELRGELLRSTATVRDTGPASGPGWTGTRYAFTARLSPEWSLTGIASVDTLGRVRRIVTTITSKYGITQNRNLTFGDFGTPVSVTAPPASQVQYTRSPYWGLYF